MLFDLFAGLTLATGLLASGYAGWCVRQARPYAKAEVPRWKLWSLGAQSMYDWYEPPGQRWLERGLRARAVVPIAFFSFLGFVVAGAFQ
jgi:hypothetical protein